MAEHLLYMDGDALLQTGGVSTWARNLGVLLGGRPERFMEGLTGLAQVEPLWPRLSTPSAQEALRRALAALPGWPDRPFEQRRTLNLSQGWLRGLLALNIQQHSETVRVVGTRARAMAPHWLWRMRLLLFKTTGSLRERHVCLRARRSETIAQTAHQRADAAVTCCDANRGWHEQLIGFPPGLPVRSGRRPTGPIAVVRQVQQDHPGSRLELSGPISRSNRRYQQRPGPQIRRLGLHGTVTFTREGMNTHAALCDFDMTVITSVSKGMPHTLLEPMQAAGAIMAIRVGGVPEPLDDAVVVVALRPRSPGGPGVPHPGTGRCTQSTKLHHRTGPGGLWAARRLQSHRGATRPLPTPADQQRRPDHQPCAGNLAAVEAEPSLVDSFPLLAFPLGRPATSRLPEVP